jgi:hypothetical protein
LPARDFVSEISFSLRVSSVHAIPPVIKSPHRHQSSPPKAAALSAARSDAPYAQYRYVEVKYDGSELRRVSCSVANVYLDRCFRVVIVIIEKVWGVVYLSNNASARQNNDRVDAQTREWGRARSEHHDSDIKNSENQWDEKNDLRRNNMSNYARPLPSHLRNQSLGGSQQHSPVLLARIAEKKAELANLKDLEALSGGLADQMQMLADKLSTLSDGTEGTQNPSKIFIEDQSAVHVY